MTEPRYLLDTDTLVYIRRGRPDKARRRFNRLQPGESALSVITYGELIYGIEKQGATAQAWAVLEELTQLIPVLQLSPEVAKVYGVIRALLAANGELIGANDLWIAAHARSRNMILVTNNEREFRRVPGLKIENWIA